MNLPRRAAGLWTLLFLLLTWGGEAGGVHPCPHHAQIGRSGAAPTAAPAHHGGEHAPASPADHGGEHGGCTCASGCPTADGPLLQAVSPWRAPVAFHDRTRLSLAADRPAARTIPHFLPYAQAPPALG